MHSSAPTGAELDALCERLQLARQDLAPVAGGTLGATYVARGQTPATFVKSYSTPAGHENLRLEGALLDGTYGPAINLQRLEIESHGHTRLWLVMDELHPTSNDIAPAQVLAMIDDYNARLGAPHGDEASPPEGSDIIALARQAPAFVDQLSAAGKAATGTVTVIRDALRDIEACRLAHGRIICHGDLSPRNILSKNGQLIAIDWEDALWAFPGFDYLYWLTFLENRRLYTSDAILGVTPLGKTLERSVMIVVVTIKAFIAHALKADTHHKLTLDARVSEILAIP